MTTTLLHIVLKKTIYDLGMDILKSPMLVNILTDYRALDVHGPILKELVDSHLQYPSK